MLTDVKPKIAFEPPEPILSNESPTEPPEPIQEPIYIPKRKAGTLTNNPKRPNSTKVTTLLYKSGEVKIEKFTELKENNVILYYKSGVILFEGTIAMGSTIKEGSWYYDNGELYYKGTFNKQGMPEGPDVVLYYENGDKKYIGNIEKGGFIKMNDTPKEKIKPDFGKLTIVLQSKDEWIEIPKGLICLNWKKSYFSDSEFLKQVFDEENFILKGSIKNGHFDGDGFIYFQKDDESQSNSMGVLRKMSKKISCDVNGTLNLDKIDSSSQKRPNSPSTNLLNAPKAGYTVSPYAKKGTPGLLSKSPPDKRLFSTPTDKFKVNSTPSPKNGEMIQRFNKTAVPIQSPMAAISNVRIPTPNKDLLRESTLDIEFCENLEISNGSMVTIESIEIDSSNISHSYIVKSPFLEHSMILSKHSEKKTAPNDLNMESLNSESEKGWKDYFTEEINEENCCSKKQLYKKDDNKVLFFRGNFKDGLIHGPVTFYLNYEDDIQDPIFNGFMKAGKLNGPGTAFYSSGKKFLEAVWSEDHMIGRAVGLYDNENKYFEGTFDEEGGHQVNIYDRRGDLLLYTGKTWPVDYEKCKVEWKEGVSYDKISGNKRCEGNWINSKLDGPEIITYDQSGQLHSIGSYKNGHCLQSKEFYKDGQLKLETGWTGQRWNGLVKRYGRTGNVQWEGYYENGQKDGSGTEYYEPNEAFGVKNVKKYEGTWKKGKLNGDRIKYWDEKGVLRFEGCYVDDQKQGQGTQYHVNGNLECNATFKKGCLHGNGIRIFSNDGFPVFEGKYWLGYRKGLGRVWDLDGKMRMMGWYDGSSNYISDSKSGWIKNSEGGFIKNMNTEVK